MKRKDVTLDPKIANQRKAVADFSGFNGVEAANLGAIVERLTGLLAARWTSIADVAMSEEKGGKIKVSAQIAIDMTKKAFSGNVSLSFKQRTKDVAPFSVKVPDALTVP